jgi:predicted small secreted protein
MKILKLLLAAALLAGCALMAGCGTSAQIESHAQYRMAGGEKLRLQLDASAMHSAENVSILRERLQSGLSSNGWLASGNHASHTLEVRVESYRMRSDSARFWTGIASGTDSMVSSVTLKDARGRTLMQFTVDSHNTTSWGSTQTMIDDNADKIIATLKGER